ncbi:MAG: hypothetical protein RLZZ370_790, partial [Bacteroidota bacterium]
MDKAARFRRFFARVSLVLFMTLLVLVTILNAGLFFYGEKIEAIAIERLNRFLKSKVTVQNVDLVFWSSFPRVSLKLDQVVVGESEPVTGAPLLRCQSLMVAFHPIELLQGRYRIRALHMQKGFLNVAERGSAVNYDILKTDSGSSGGGSANLDLQQVSLEDVRVRYQELAGETTIDLNLKEFLGKGAFMSENFTAEVQTLGRCESVEISGLQYLKSKALSLNAKLNVESGNRFRFSNAALKFDQAGFLVNGSIISGKDQSMLDLRIKGQKMTIADLLGVLPLSWTAAVRDFQSKGEISFDGSVVGAAGAGAIPKIAAHVQLNKAALIPPGSAVQISDIQGNALVENRDDDPGTFDLSVKPLSFKPGKGSFEGDLLMLDLSDPMLESHLKGSLDLSDVPALAAMEGVTAGGSLMVNLNLKGKIADFGSNIGAVEAGGTVQLHQAMWKQPAKNIDIQQAIGTCDIDPSNLSLHHCEASISGQNVRFSGSMPGFWPYVFRDSGHLELHGNLESDQFNLEPFIVAESSAKPAAANSYILPDDMDLDVSVRLGKLHYKKFDAQSITGVATFHRGRLRLSNLNMQTLDGTLQLSGTFNKDEKGYICKTAFKGTDLNISKLFYALDNFGQQDLTDKHLEGRANISGEAMIPFDRALNVIQKELYTYADLELKGGVLKNYEPLMSLSSYVKVDELKEIKFSNLKNNIEIADEQIRIPSMSINNSALNIEITGTHRFDNYMDYGFRVRVSDVVAAKYGWRKNNAEGRYEDNGSKGMSVFVKMEGYPDQLKFSYNRQKVKEQIQESAKKEKQELREAIKSEFSG